MTTQFRLSPRTRIAATDYGAAVLGPAGSYFRLNRTAYRVLVALLDGQDKDGVISTLRSGFAGTSSEQTDLGEHVDGIVAEFIRTRIVVRS